MRTNSSEYRCPKCGEGLSTSPERLTCMQCRTVFPVREGIVDFRCGRHDYYFNPVPVKEMDLLTQNATRENWPETIRAFLKHVKYIPGWLDNLMTDGRYAWKLMLDLTPDTVLLDIGCGLGNLSANLAPHVRKVYAMDLTYQRLEFSRKRFALFNSSDDIEVIAGGDAEHLPFASGSIDSVVLSGVLEWVGEGDTEPFQKGTKSKRIFNMLAFHFGSRSARSVQLRFLREIRRILKEKGQLFIAIENRLNWEYFTGRRDHHSGLKFGALLPRFAANLYSMAVNRGPYRTFTYSIPGYRRLLSQAGFGTVEFLGLARGYSFLEEIHKADADIPQWRPDEAAGLKARIKTNKYFVPAYGIIASSAPRPWRRLQDSIFEQIDTKLGRNGLRVSSYRVTDKDKVVVFAESGGQDIVLKIPCGVPAKTFEDRAFRLLADIEAMPELRGLAPRPLLSGSVNGCSFFVESRVGGEPLSALLRKQGRTAMLLQIADLLERISTKRMVCAFDGDLYDKHVEKPLAAIGKVIDDPVLQSKAADYLRRRLYGINVAIGVTHGDFGVSNIFGADGKISGLIDWEAGGTQELPVIDAVSYLTSVQRLFNKRDNVSTTLPLLASGAWPSKEEKVFLEAHYQRCGMDARHHEGIVYLHWLHAVDFRLRYRMAFDPVAIDLFIKKVLSTMLAEPKEQLNLARV